MLAALIMSELQLKVDTYTCKDDALGVVDYEQDGTRSYCYEHVIHMTRYVLYRLWHKYSSSASESGS